MAPEPVPPRRFRVIDALSRQVLADDANAPETLEVLRGVSQPVDVSIYVWEPRPEQWRLLTSREKKLLWEARQRRRDRLQRSADLRRRRRAGAGLGELRFDLAGR